MLLQAIGAAGAAALLSAVAARGRANARPGGKVAVLTHCNTGSLATAGYGTALGVVRALHEMGKLERCYACETRPYNQGGYSSSSTCLCSISARVLSFVTIGLFSTMSYRLLVRSTKQAPIATSGPKQLVLDHTNHSCCLPTVQEPA